MEIIVAILAIIGFMFFRRRSLSYQIKKTIKSKGWHRKVPINFNKIRAVAIAKFNGILIPYGDITSGVIFSINIDNTPYIIGAIPSNSSGNSFTDLAVLPYYEGDNKTIGEILTFLGNHVTHLM